MLLSALAALGGMGLQFGMGQLNSSINTGRQVAAQKELMSHQFELQKKHISNYHQWNTSSLRNAGINPMLSGNYGGGSGGSYGATVSGGDSYDIQSGINAAQSAMAMANNLRKGKAEAELAEQQSKLAPQAQKVEIANQEAELIKKASEIGLIQSQIDNINSSTAANLLENKWRGSQHWTEYRYGKELRELYPVSKLENVLSPVLRPMHSALSPFIVDGNASNGSPIVIKKGSKWTNYKYQYFNRK